MFRWPGSIKTERLLLIPIKREAMVQIHKGERPSISKYPPHPQWPLPILMEAFPVMANDLLDDPSLLGWHAWALVNKDDGLVIGDVGFKGSPDEQGLIKIGYSIIPSYRNKGFAREAVEAMTETAKQDDNVSRIIAEVLALNIPSIKLLSSLGWEHVSDNGEMEVWSFHEGG